MNITLKSTDLFYLCSDDRKHTTKEVDLFELPIALGKQIGNIPEQKQTELWAFLGTDFAGKKMRGPN